jgi:hypothetical protein
MEAPLIGYGTLLILIPKGTDVQYKRNLKYSGGRLGGPMPQHVIPLLGILYLLCLRCHPLRQRRASCPVFLLLEAGAQHYTPQHYSLSRSTGPPCIKAATRDRSCRFHGSGTSLARQWASREGKRARTAMILEVGSDSNGMFGFWIGGLWLHPMTARVLF